MKRLLQQFPRFKIEHVARSSSRHADALAGPSYYERTNYALLSRTVGLFEVQFATGGSKEDRWEGRGFISFAIGYRVGRKRQQSSFLR